MSSGRLHSGLRPVFFERRHRPPDVQQLRCRDGVADPEEAPQIRSPSLCWRHRLPFWIGWWVWGWKLEGLLHQDLLSWGLLRGGVGWGDEACPDPLSIYQRGAVKVQAGEGGDTLLMLYCCRPQPIK